MNERYALAPILSGRDYLHVILPATKAGKMIVCQKCGAVFENDDLAFANETGLCQYCHETIEALLIEL